jgi:hypothetical protein
MRTLRTVWLLGCIVALGGLPAAAESVQVSVPGSVTFWVNDVSASSEGSPGAATVSFESASLNSGRSLRISVRATSSTLTAPSGTPIPVSSITWTVTGVAGGTGSSGTLNSSDFTQVFVSSANPTSGAVELRWTLAQPGSGIRAGNHSLALEWRFESVP